ncbi:trypco2 family protein [Actinacidiphila oryziradicis]
MGPRGSMGFDGTELSQAIAAIRTGLTSAQAQAADSPIRFTAKD